MFYKKSYNWILSWFTLLELLIVIIIIWIIFTTVNYINYRQVDNIKQISKIEAFVSNYNQILLNCMANNCNDSGWNPEKRDIADVGVIKYPNWQSLKLLNTDWLIIENANGLTLSFSDYKCDSQQTDDLYHIVLKNINGKSLQKCFDIDKKCKIYSVKCL